MDQTQPAILFNPARLALEAKALAHRHRTQLTLGRRPLQRLHPLVASSGRVLQETYRALAASAKQDEEILPAGEWILDNFYIIQEQTQQIKEHLPPAYYRTLPRLTSGACRGFPRVYELVRELATFTDNVLDEQNLSLFLQAYQEEDLLTLSELWAVPIMARFVLIQHLEARGRDLLDARRTRRAASQWAARITRVARDDAATRSDLLGRMAEEASSGNALFLSTLLRGLEAGGGLTEPEQVWLEEQFPVEGIPLEDEAQRQAQQQVSVANAVLSLRQIAEADWSAFVEALSVVEQTLRLDPAGIYPEMDAETRNRYRGQVEHLAEYAPLTEFEIAQQVLLMAEEAAAGDLRPAARHVGWCLIGSQADALESIIQYRAPLSRRLRRFAYHHADTLFLGTISLLTLLFMGFPYAFVRAQGSSTWILALVTAASVLPALDLAVALTNWFVTHLLPPRVLPKMAFEERIPADHQALVVVPTLITSAENAREQVEQLEIRALANPDPAFRFALLSGFSDAPEEVMPGDAVTLDAAVTAVRALNKRHGDAAGDRFFLLHRARQWNPKQGVWMGWERKRGKLEELGRLLRDPAAKTSFTTLEGGFASATADRVIRYVITLDADTQLPPGSARNLVRTAAHPLNRPRFEPDVGRVTEGYGVLQPRVSILPEAALRTPFTRIFAGNVGVDPYTTAVSDAYQDLLGEGIYTGKGLYHVDAFRATLEGAFPENTVLSHDLLEGNYVRTALVTDIELFDDYPSTYLPYAKRLHRWIRGDWQILPWLFRRVPTPQGSRRNPLTPMGRWKIFDNLRRSLTPPALLLFLLLGWTAFPGPPFVWTVLGLFVLAFPIFAGVTSAVVRRSRKATWKHYMQSLGTDVMHNMLRAGLSLVILPHQAFLSADAVVRTLWRLFVSRKNLLEWVTASQAEQRGSGNGAYYLRVMAVSVVFGMAVLGGIVLIHPAALFSALPVAVLWVAAPYVAWWLGRPRFRASYALRDEERRLLHTIARRTWAYFDQYVGPEHRWLPPDNVQQEPWRGLAPRTSPTNIGLALLSTQAAYDLGYLPRSVLVHRLAEMLGSMRLLDRYRGHFYNWYYTKRGTVLPPHYVSTVDSGNLAACLLTLKQALLETRTASWPSPVFFEGLRATLHVAEEGIAAQHEALGTAVSSRLVEKAGAVGRLLSGAAPSSLTAWWNTLRVLRLHAEELRESKLPGAGEEALKDLRYWLEQPLAQIKAQQLELQTLFPWLAEGVPLPEALDAVSSLGQLLAALREGTAAALADERGLRQAALTVAAWLDEADRLAAWCGELVAVMDFGFLFNEDRGLFSIGFNEDRMAQDESTYDLFASEARVASFLAIAKGEVPPAHWFRLSRRLTEVDNRRVLVSWGGTMFEYLMPLLFMRRYETTLLDETYESVVFIQSRSGQRRGQPWGVSESAYYMLNLDLDYQYRAFGVPELGLKRGLAEDYVVAPYAAMLALPVDLPHAIENLQRLQREGAYGSLGFYEAVDYTRTRVPSGSERSIIYTYMAHHQGMSLLALANVLCGNRMQRRFHTEPLVRSSELLLQERLPQVVTLTPMRAVEDEQEPSEGHVVHEAVEHVPREGLLDAFPHVHLLSNGRYRALLTAAGTGYSAFEELALTAWRADRTRDADGLYLYVRDRDRGTFWSMGHQPVQRQADRYDVWFHTNKVEMARVDDWIETFMEVCVSPLEDIELRRYTLTNYSDQPRLLELTSYAEVVLNDPRGHEAHPAFSKLFVQTEYVPEHHALLAHRRSRSPEDRAAWLVHMLTSEHLEEAFEPLQYETDRAKFIGRGRTRANPQALDPGVSLSGSVGSVLDPVVSLRRVVELSPGEKLQVTFGLGAARSREQARALADQYNTTYAVDRAFSLARVYGLIQLQNLDISPEQALAFHKLAGALLYGHPGLRAPEEVLQRNRRQQAALWAYGISGDLPLIVARVADRDAMPVVRTLLKAHAYWWLNGLAVDLLILNEHPPSYADALQDLLVQTAEASTRHGGQDEKGHVYVRGVDGMSQEDLNLVQTVARIVIDGDGDLPELKALALLPAASEAFFFKPVAEYVEQGPEAEEEASASEEPSPQVSNGYGSFSRAGDEYVIRLTPADGGLKRPPLPWVNVVANASFGFLATDSGAGYTWSLNSRENRLTPWSNDPICDPHGEALYLRDDEAGVFWSPTPGPVPEAAAYEVRHGFGYTRYAHESHALAQTVLQFVPRHDPVKIIRVHLVNLSDRPRRLSLFRYQRWVLGVLPEQSGRFVVTEHDAQTGAVFATNAYNNEFAGRVAFAAVAGAANEAVAYTTDRTAFLGRHGRVQAPAALRSKRPLDGRTGAGLDPCAVFHVEIDLAPGQAWKGAFLLGEAESRATARLLVARYREPAARGEALQDVRTFWTETRSTIQVKTPSPAIDRMVNGWLLYQNLACRLWARSAFYQSGGAFGFRDQLQDAAALIYTRPDLTRRQILLHAAHQFVEGDVLHWWHPPTGRGIRTRISDDLLWLPYVTAFYVQTTGDRSVLDEQAPFISARVLEEGEDEAYLVPEEAGEVASLYDHCCRALDRSLTRGPHHLPLMGSGDWNDGMNRVGHDGRGESVWLGFFLYRILGDFIPLCVRQEDPERAERYRAYRTPLKRALNEAGWDGAWYRRAYYDDGTPLGAAENDECRIDALAQAWAVLSGAAPRDRAEQAMQAVERFLVSEGDKLIRLLTPPFDQTEKNPGYIKGYVPGVRENGGQYTHAALWVIGALARLGQGDRAGALLEMLSPVSHTRTSEEVGTYQAEPYVVTADIYGVAPHVGRGGWTWYTGSAGWMYRIALESLLGFRLLEGRTLALAPCIPAAWPQVELVYQIPGSGTTYAIQIVNPEGVQQGVASARLDGKALKVKAEEVQVALARDEATHHLIVTLGSL